VDEPEQVTQLVKRFFDQAEMKELSVGREAVPFILQPVIGDHPDAAAQLGFAEHEGQDRNTQVIAGYRKQERTVRFRGSQGRVERVEVRDDVRGIVLEPLLVQEGREIDVNLTDIDVASEDLPQWEAERGHDATIRISQRKEEDRIHGDRFRPYFSIL